MGEAFTRHSLRPLIAEGQGSGITRGFRPARTSGHIPGFLNRENQYAASSWGIPRARRVRADLPATAWAEQSITSRRQLFWIASLRSQDQGGEDRVPKQDSFFWVLRRRALGLRPAQVLVEPRHDLDEIARPRAVVELCRQNAVPGIAAGPGRARQAEDVGGA